MKASKNLIFKIVSGAALAALLVSGFYFGYQQLSERPPVVVTVFVHGTVGSTFNILNPFQCLADSVNDDAWSVKTIKRYRNHPAMRYDQLLEDEGLVEFGLHFEHSHASYHLIQAYDELAQQVQSSDEVRKYALFGWSGLLSHQARKEAAALFYDQLCDYRDSLKKEYGVDPIIRIIAHSHGGNVGLLLADREKICQRGLTIETLFMLGTPIQCETAPLIESLLFKRIVLGYSNGDNVQASDYFSTCNRTSYQRMADLVNLGAFVTKNPDYTRCDVQFFVNGDAKRITHSNMWLVARSTPILDFMDPLPLVVMAPLFIASLNDNSYCTLYEAQLNGSFGRCSACLISCIDEEVAEPYIEHEKPLREKHLSDILFKWRNKLLAEWHAGDVYRHVMFNAKNAHAIKDVLWG